MDAVGGRGAAMGVAFDDAEELPAARDPLELRHAALLELDPRAGHEIPHRPRHHDLARAGVRRHARPDVDSDPADLAVDLLALARVQAGAHLDPEAADRVDDR